MLRYLVLFGVALGVMSLASTPEKAEARPQYLKTFAKTYKNLFDQALEKKCFVCHYGKEKTNHNDYGTAMKKYFEEKFDGEKEKNIKDVKVIKAALKEIEKKDSKVKDKTFGELIKEDKLPGTNPEKKEDGDK